MTMRITNKEELNTLRAAYAGEKDSSSVIIQKLVATIDWLVTVIDEASQDLLASAEPFDRAAGKLLAARKLEEQE